MKKQHRDGALITKSWTPQILPLQLTQIGELLLVSFPFEITTVASYRLQKSMYDLMINTDIKEIMVMKLNFFLENKYLFAIKKERFNWSVCYSSKIITDSLYCLTLLSSIFAVISFINASFFFSKLPTSLRFFTSYLTCKTLL